MIPAKRYFSQGLWGRSGRAIRDPQASEMDNVVPMRRPDLRQGRDATNPVGRVSMYAGKPVEDEEEMDNAMRGLFWRTYFAAGVLLALCAFLMAVWPN